MNRNLRLIQELDQKVLDDLDKKQGQYLVQLKNSKDKKNELKKPENKQISAEIQQIQKQILSLSKEKINISNQLYEKVDDSINKIDSYLAKQENEIKKNQIEAKESKIDIEDSQSIKKKKQDQKFQTKYKQKQYLFFQKSKNQDQQQILQEQTIDYDIVAKNSNEPLYCYCQRVSFGKMLACDNQLCLNEWFHFECAGITQQPKGKWYCRNCKNIIKK